MYLKLFIFKFYFTKIVKRIKIGSNAKFIFHIFVKRFTFFLFGTKKTCNRRVRKKRKEIMVYQWNKQNAYNLIFILKLKIVWRMILKTFPNNFSYSITQTRFRRFDWLFLIISQRVSENNNVKKIREFQKMSAILNLPTAWRLFSTVEMMW